MPPIGPVGSAGFTFRPSSYGRLEPVGAAAATSAQLRPENLRTLLSDLTELRGALDRVARFADRLGRARGGSRAGSVSATSATPLDLGVTYTTLRSIEEVNTTPTSFTPFGPTVSGSSTSLPTIGGVYDGDQGDDVLTFEFLQTTTLPSNRIRVRVRDGAGETVENLRFDDLDPDTPLTLRNGLTLSLGEGDTVRRDTFQVAVSTSVGSAVDPSKPFDGTRNENPNFELGLGVGAGSFEVNGVRIDVLADDSIDSVLARIEASEAGVDATFDATSERVVITSRTAGPDGRVILSNDTSGFLTATKLDGASEVLGSDAEQQLSDPIATVPALSGITAGNFEVNGVQIAVDPSTDSLYDVIDRINASGAGVTAAFDTGTGRFSVAPVSAGSPLELSDGTSGFFSALDVATGRFDPSTRKGSFLPHQRRLELRDALEDASRALEDLLGRERSADVSSLVESLGTEIQAVLDASSEADGGRLARKVGFRLSSSSDDSAGFEIETRKLERALRSEPSDLHALLFGDRTREGLVDSLVAGLDTAQTQIEDLLGTRLGRQIDLLV